MSDKPKPDIDRLFAEVEPIRAALNRGVQAAVRRHKQTGVPMVVWRDGKVAWISPEEFEAELDADQSDSP